MASNVSFSIIGKNELWFMHLFYSCSKAKRKKQAVPEKPVKKQKTGESSKGAASSKQSSNRDENMFQVKINDLFKAACYVILNINFELMSLLYGAYSPEVSFSGGLQ